MRRGLEGGAAILGGGVLAMGLGLGGAHPVAFFSVVPVLLAGVLLVFRATAPDRAPTPTRIALFLSAFSLLQSAPLPLGALSRLSPSAASVWERALHPFGEKVSSGALSLDPGASLREALKWALYGLVFWAATLIVERKGRHPVGLFVVGCGLSMALLTLGHGLFAASRVFGVYEPTFATSRWHLGPLLNPNTLSGYLNLAAFTGLGLCLSRRLAPYRWLLGVGVAVIFGVSVLSGSRGGVWLLPLGLLLFGVVILLRRKPGSDRPRDLRSRAPLLVAVGCALLFAGLGLTQATREELLQGNFEKLFIASFALPMIREYWAFGVGRGAFESGFIQYAPAAKNHVYSHPENWLVQWVGEWGVPVALGALLLLFFHFRPRARDRRGSSLGMGAATGVLVLLIQNLVDLGLELPGIALLLFTVLGLLSARPTKRRLRGLRGLRAELGWAGPLLATSLLFFSALAWGRHDVSLEREALHQASLELSVSDPAGLSAFRARLRQAMLRHPADPYFARLGGSVALGAGDVDPMPWVERALEQGLEVARSHFLAAHALARRGATKQALFQLRKAAELDPGLSKSLGVVAAGWSSSLDDLLRGTPAGASGAAFLTGAARALSPRPEARDLSESALREALRRDPGYAPAKKALFSALLDSVKEGRCQKGCEHELFDLASALGGLDPERATGAELRARVLSAIGRYDEASSVLGQRCGELSGDPKVLCLEAHLGLLRSHSPLDRAAVAHAAAELSGEACVRAERCAPALVAAGDALRKIGDPASALAQYERAAREAPGVAVLLRVAEAANALGRHGRAEVALRRAQGLSEPEQALRIQERRDALKKELLHKAP